MTVSAYILLLQTRFNTQWGSTTPIAWDNVEYTPVSGTSFVEFRILPNSGDFASVGKHPLVRTLGMVEINVRTPVKIGPITGAVLADTALAAFKDSNGRAWSSGGLRCRAGYVMDQVEEGEWFRHIVIIPFEYDEHF